MLVKKKITTIEEVETEITLPAYFLEKRYDKFFAITSDKIIRVYERSIGITPSTSMFFAQEVAEAAAFEPVTEAEFLAAYTIARMNTEFLLPEAAGHE